jgi:hypothetical protein
MRVGRARLLIRGGGWTVVSGSSGGIECRNPERLAPAHAPAADGGGGGVGFRSACEAGSEGCLNEVACLVM